MLARGDEDAGSRWWKRRTNVMTHIVGFVVTEVNILGQAQIVTSMQSGS